MSGRRRRGVSGGTVVMLIVTAAVLACTIYVLARLSGGPQLSSALSSQGWK